ncbi:MAG TPA: APC family permease [Polyangiaceae bacterium]|jgi:amino acid transporter|nr:APC family permease [Polyangiaceae bacterium]
MSIALKRIIFGAPKDVKDPHAFHKLSLVALLAWVGLGADGLSSSAYGPDEAYRALGEHTGLAFFLALATAATVFIISYGYSRIIEQFPSGGGGYVVASKLLSPRIGVVSGAALLVDYVLTITISIASGADAIFSFLPAGAIGYKFLVAFVGLVVLTVMNIRGVKESVTALVPVFVLFLITHAILIALAIGGNAAQAGHVASEVHASITRTGIALGTFGLLKLFVHAYSMGGGTYTGIEAVSNGVGMMREPRVRTAKRTMTLMAASLAITAGGILLAYLLVHAHPEEGKTMNAVLFERVAGSWHIGGLNVGKAFIVAALLSEGTLLFVAAQAGFLDGPRVMANMATDSWMPHRFAALSDRLAMRNGVMIMALAAFGALIYTRGDVSRLVVMYSINVFLTFSLSNLAMARFWIKHRREHADEWLKHLFAHAVALALCATILVITILEKFIDGGWLTLLVTAVLVVVCFGIKQHYGSVVRALRKLDSDLPSPPEVEEALALAARKEEAGAGFEEHHGLMEHHTAGDPDAEKPVAILLVGGYSGLGRHALLTLLRMFPHHFSGIVFLSVAVVDSESFKGADQLAALEERTRKNLLCYEHYARSLGLPAASMFSVGTEVAVEVEKSAAELAGRYPRALFVAGQLIFEEDTFWNRVLHNETAFMVQKRLQRRGMPMIVVPVRIDLRASRPMRAAALAA